MSDRRDRGTRSGRPRPGTELPPFHSPREITSIRPAGRWLSDYEVAVCQAQSDLDAFDTGGWLVQRESGGGIYEADSTALRHPDWFAFRDPSTLWQRTYVALQAEEEATIVRAIATARGNGSFADFCPQWCREVLGPYYEAWACAESGLFIALSRAVREALSDTVSTALVYAATDRARHGQDIAAFSLALTHEVPTYVEGLGPATWTSDPALAPARALVERLLDCPDWGEVVFVLALLFDPAVAGMFCSRFLRRYAPRHGDVVTPVIVAGAERDRERLRAGVHELGRMLLAPDEAVPVAENAKVLQGWVDSWAGDVRTALDALDPLFHLPEVHVDAPAAARSYVLRDCGAGLEALGLDVPAPLRL